MHGQEIIDDEILAILNRMSSVIREKAATLSTFDISIPSGESIEGTIAFYPVLEIETGFAAPGTFFHEINDLAVLEQWRA
jgi:hypothetical protein